ncbi:MAG: hypothetical protein VZT48_12835, partial [Bulleidia sp.]|nr:hypothetical protein [Bulleidia sp.]
TDDALKTGERKYELEVQVKDHPEIEVPQYRHIIILNAKGKKGDAGGERVNGFLDYLDTLKNPGNNEFVNDVDSEVEEAKKDPSTREAAMTLEQMMYGKQQEGLKQGREEGKASTICTLHASGMSVKEIADRLHLEEAKVLAYIQQGRQSV